MDRRGQVRETEGDERDDADDSQDPTRHDRSVDRVAGPAAAPDGAVAPLDGLAAAPRLPPRHSTAAPIPTRVKTIGSANAW